MVMDGIIRAAGTSGGGGGAAVAAFIDDDLAGDGMQCSNHRYKNNAAGGGGICAFCLQEKLGKLVSSSSTSLFNGGSSSSSPSLRSDPSSASAGASLSLSLRPGATVSSSSSTNGRHRENRWYCSTTTNQIATRRARIPFLLSQKKKKVMADHHHPPSDPVLKRSKSAAAPHRRAANPNPNPYLPPAGDYYHKRWGFWSFLYHSKPKPDKTSSSGSSSARDLKPAAAPDSTPAPVPKRAEYVVVVDESVDSPNSGSSNATSFGRKVFRSRSVGCGSRSFSGDFFERISTGFGDCTLRRVESQREGKRCSSSDAIKEKVRCGGIFGGFMVTSSSSYWLPAGEDHDVNGKMDTAVHGRNRSWGWALASPMRAFRKPSPTNSSSSTRRDVKSSSKNNATPNLAAIPSLLTARG